MRTLEMFHGANPGVQVTTERIRSEEALNRIRVEGPAGSGPDLLFGPTDLLGDLVAAGLLLPLDDQFFAESLANILPAAVEGSKVGGQLYSMPQALNVAAMFFNRDDPPLDLVPPSDTVFNTLPGGTEQGIAYFGRPDLRPKLLIEVYGSAPAAVRTYIEGLRGSLALWRRPLSRDDLLALISSGTRLGIPQNPYFTWGLYSALGDPFIDPAGRCVSPEGGMAAGLDYLGMLGEAGADFSDIRELEQAFMSGEIDAVIGGSWSVRDFKEALGDKLRVAALPSGPRGPSRPIVGMYGWQINRHSTRKDTAVDFVRYMTSPEIEQVFADTTGQIPADRRVLIEDPLVQDLIEATASGVPNPQMAGVRLDYYLQYLEAAQEQVLAGDEPADAAANACAQINEQLGSNRLVRVSAEPRAEQGHAYVPAARRLQDATTMYQVVDRRADRLPAIGRALTPGGGLTTLFGRSAPFRFLAPWTVQQPYTRQGAASAGHKYSRTGGQFFQPAANPEDLVILISASEAEALDEIAYILDPKVARNGTHSYRKTRRGFHETVTETQGEINVTLYRSGASILPKVNLIAPAVVTITAGSPPAPVPWCLQVVGGGVSGTDNVYALTGTTGSYYGTDAPQSRSSCP